MTISRRSFLTRSAAGAAFASPLAAAARGIVGAHDDLRVAVVGVRGRGNQHIRGFEKLDGVRVVALCDADKNVLHGRVTDLSKKTGREIAGYVDVRKLLEDDSIDIVSIATQNHWHSLMGIWACQAGKDVYCEKPVSHNIWEGRQLVAASEKYGRIVQCGTQSRSNPGLRDAIAFVQQGGLGEIRLSRGLCYKPRPSIGKVGAPTPIPDHIDYDLWCGPAPKAELMRAKLHYDWHWVWATGNGDLGNQGIHQMDMCRWALGEDALAPTVISVGGRLGYDDDGETPNTMVTLFDYPSAPLVFEVRGLPRKAGDKQMDRFMGAGIGCVIHCEGGWLSITSYAGGVAYDNAGEEVKKFRGGGDHFANFVKAVRSRDVADLNAPIVEGHLSSALCHMGNISYRVGEVAPTRRITSAVQNDIPLAESWGRMRDHLAANRVDLDATPATLGARLRLDPETERFVDHEAANRLAKGTYRAPFVVPAEV